VVLYYTFILIVFSVFEETGALASWGGAEFGQLGFEAGSMVDHVQPRIVKGSRDLHFSRVAAGVAHTLALTGALLSLC
jgi:alpha-tubulin suppressor-like RCC1 family protein